MKALGLQMAASGWLKTMHFNKTDHRSLNKLFHNLLPPCLLLPPEVSGASSALGLKSW